MIRTRPYYSDEIFAVTLRKEARSVRFAARFMRVFGRFVPRWVKRLAPSFCHAEAHVRLYLTTQDIIRAKPGSLALIRAVLLCQLDPYIADLFIVQGFSKAWNAFFVDPDGTFTTLQADMDAAGFPGRAEELSLMVYAVLSIHGTRYPDPPKINIGVEGVVRDPAAVRMDD